MARARAQRYQHNLYGQADQREADISQRPNGSEQRHEDGTI
jgi:hypothetical protein